MRGRYHGPCGPGSARTNRKCSLVPPAQSYEFIGGLDPLLVAFGSILADIITGTPFAQTLNQISKKCVSGQGLELRLTTRCGSCSDLAAARGYQCGGHRSARYIVLLTVRLPAPRTDS